MRPSRSTAVASSTIMPARPMASCIRCWRCQSVALPSPAEYWHMGATAMRLGSSMGPSGRGEKRWDTGGDPQWVGENEGRRGRMAPRLLTKKGARRLPPDCRHGRASLACAMSNPPPGDRGTMIGATVVTRSGPQAAMLAQAIQTAAQAAVKACLFPSHFRHVAHGRRRASTCIVRGQPCIGDADVKGATPADDGCQQGGRNNSFPVDAAMTAAYQCHHQMR